jgi:hypothetical protein
MLHATKIMHRSTQSTCTTLSEWVVRVGCVRYWGLQVFVGGNTNPVHGNICTAIARRLKDNPFRSTWVRVHGTATGVIASEHTHFLLCKIPATSNEHVNICTSQISGCFPSLTRTSETTHWTDSKESPWVDSGSDSSKVSPESNYTSLSLSLYIYIYIYIYIYKICI